VETKTGQLGRLVSALGSILEVLGCTAIQCSRAVLLALTEAMRCANEMADLLAEQAAERVRIGRPFRDWLHTRFGQSKQNVPKLT